MQFISLILLLILNIYNNAFIVHTLDSNTEEFDWSLTKEILKNKDTDKSNRNVILSPYLIKLSLSLLKKALAENSESQKELSILFPNLKKDHEKAYWQKTLGSLKKKNEDYSVLMGSLIALAKNATVDPSYEREAKELYNTELQTYDFDRKDETVKMLNEYVLDKTERHVKDIATTDLIDGAKAIILNTIYFKAEWELGFEDTFKHKFSVDNNKHVETTFMQNEFSLHYTESETLDSQLIRMNYKGGKYAMYIVLPKKVDGLQNVINNLDGKILQNEISKMKETYITLIIPKFKFESSFSLVKHLKELGIEKIFTRAASIELIKVPGLTLPLQVKEVVQKMGIVFNEFGTEAYGAVATSVLEDRFGSSDFPIRVIVDHPFLFFIEDVTTGAVVFSGKVINPKDSN